TTTRPTTARWNGWSAGCGAASWSTRRELEQGAGARRGDAPRRLAPLRAGGAARAQRTDTAAPLGAGGGADAAHALQQGTALRGLSLPALALGPARAGLLLRAGGCGPAAAQRRPPAAVGIRGAVPHGGDGGDRQSPLGGPHTRGGAGGP